MNNLKSKVNGYISNAATYWKVPPLGRYMNYKEILSYSFGGIGVYFIVEIVANHLMLSSTNQLLGAGIGIEYDHIYWLYLISTILGIPLTMIRAKMVDNSISKQGKYRPYLLKMGIPAAILAIGYLWMPYEKWITQGSVIQLVQGESIWNKTQGYWVCCAVILLFNIGFQFFYNFYYDAYNCLIYVMSPNSQERTDAVAIKSVVYSFAPTLLNLFMPIFAKYISNGSLQDLKLYRYVYPPICIVSMFLSIIVYRNVREKIIQARTHVISVSLWDSFKTIAKNKYFWIISFAGWLGFLEIAYGNIFLWLYEYGHACSPEQYSLIWTVYGNASLWGMIAAPICIRKFGKKKTIVVTNLLNIVFLGIMLPNVSSIYWALFCLYLNALVGSFSHVLEPSIQADIRDYQQYISGERIDGMFATVGIIGTFITMLTSRVIPYMYEKMGLTAKAHPELGKDYMKVMDVTRGYITKGIFGDDLILYNILRVLIIASVCGAVMNVIPYFFYNLSEAKHRGMVRVLKIRALFEDYGNGVLSDNDLVEAIDLVREAREHIGLEKLPEDNEKIKEAKKTKNHEAVAKAKENRNANISFNEWVEDSELVLNELNIFSSSLMKQKAQYMQDIYDRGVADLTHYNPSVLKQAKALPAGTHEEKEYRAFAVKYAKMRKNSAKLIAKNFKEGIKEFDLSLFEELFVKHDEIYAQIESVNREIAQAKKAKNASAVEERTEFLKKLREEKEVITKKIDKANKDNIKYNRAAKPFLDAKKLIMQQENYSHFDEIASQYDEAKARAKQAELDAVEAEEKRKQAEKEFGEKLKASKKETKTTKK